LKILIYADITQYTSGEKSFETEGARTMRELIDILGEHFGAQFRDFLLADNTCIILVNGKGIMLSGLDTGLHSGDKIEILPIIGGG